MARREHLLNWFWTAGGAKSDQSLDISLRRRDQDRYLTTPGVEIHVAGGRGATFDLYPNEDVARALEYFWAKYKIVGAICHGAVALGNIPDRIRGRQVTGFTYEADKQLQSMFGSDFIIPHYPQKVLEETGAIYSNIQPYTPKVIVDGRLNVSVFEVESPVEFHEILSSLPLYPFMEVEVAALCHHPGSLESHT